MRPPMPYAGGKQRIAHQIGHPHQGDVSMTTTNVAQMGQLPTTTTIEILRSLAHGRPIASTAAKHHVTQGVVRRIIFTHKADNPAAASAALTRMINGGPDISLRAISDCAKATGNTLIIAAAARLNDLADKLNLAIMDWSEAQPVADEITQIQTALDAKKTQYDAHLNRIMAVLGPSDGPSETKEK